MPRPSKIAPKTPSEIAQGILRIVTREVAELDRKSTGIGLEGEDVRKLEILSKILKNIHVQDTPVSAAEAESVSDEDIESLCQDATP